MEIIQAGPPPQRPLPLVSSLPPLLLQGDIAAGKQSPLVRLGTERAVKVLTAATLTPYLGLLAGSLGALGLIPSSGMPLTVLPAALLSLPAALALIRFACANHLVPAAIAPLKIYATKLHMAFGLSLIVGLWASQRLPAI